MKWKQYAKDTEKIVNEYLLEIRRLEKRIAELEGEEE